ncbi:MAG: hypothetical protein DHS20C01_09040 [marine bacterium B5-7]|nr:MAG: hypothetical protein DHS20C01_09040 [marine bacterium B5-7]
MAVWQNQLRVIDMPLSTIQHQIQSLYDLRLSHQVEDFLITDRHFLSNIASDDNQRQTPEKLVFCEQDDELLVSLYLAEEALDQLSSNDPYDHLHGGNIDIFCTVLEGVSHFVYLIYNATHDRPVSRLELEVQAEVDKYFLVSRLCDSQGMRIDRRRLSAWLFDYCRFDPALKPDERARYEFANRIARAFCKRVRNTPDLDHRPDSVVSELRRFYRMRHHEKFDSALGDRPMRAP